MTPYACHNRPPFKRTLTVQDGYKPDGTRNMVEVPFRMSPLCEYTTTELGQVDERCLDCKHKHSYFENRWMQRVELLAFASQVA